MALDQRVRPIMQSFFCGYLHSILVVSVRQVSFAPAGISQSASSCSYRRVNVLDEGIVGAVSVILQPHQWRDDQEMSNFGQA